MPVRSSMSITVPSVLPAGRYLVICTNAVYYGHARGRLAPLRDLALKTLSAA
ncbi:hypothetical protein [Microtetraspora malaysiensis]|uniref:hypothetical protein n=1 Tax=Microtetraspora malaysiensis TaxID=161358 RepID=UPI003D8FB098